MYQCVCQVGIDWFGVLGQVFIFDFVFFVFVVFGDFQQVFGVIVVVVEDYVFDVFVQFWVQFVVDWYGIGVDDVYVYVFCDCVVQEY